VFKTVQQRYAPGDNLLEVLEQFRCMINDCVRIGLDEKITSLKTLSLKSYGKLSGYDVMSYYKLCAISRAVGILRSYRKAKRKRRAVAEPYVRRPQLVTCYGLKINNGKLELPFKPRRPISIALDKHTLDVLRKPNHTIQSISLTMSIVGITFSKEITFKEPMGLVGLDSNLYNLTLVDSKGKIQRYNLEEAARIKSKCQRVRSHLIRNDVRIRRKIFRKYGQKQRNKVSNILHNVSKNIVEEAKAKQFGIAMEKLTGLRRLYRKGNGQGRFYRSRINSWSYRQLQRQVEYKAEWEGVPVVYVPARNTSRKCSICGLNMKPEENRTLRCPMHGIIDRDVNAARNILARGLRFRPVALPVEAMVTASMPRAWESAESMEAR